MARMKEISDKGLPKKPRKPTKPKKPDSGQVARYIGNNSNYYSYANNPHGKVLGAFRKIFKAGKPGKISLDEHPELFIGDKAPFSIEIDVDAHAINMTVKDDNYSRNLSAYKEKMTQYLAEEIEYRKALLAYEQHQAEKRFESAAKELDKINREIKLSGGNDHDEKLTAHEIGA